MKWGKKSRKIYWFHCGKYESAVAKLNKLIPPLGEVDKPEVNQHLEAFRQASNCYYDLYNNGLCNRLLEFRDIFGFVPKKEPTSEDVKRTENVMNQIIVAAAKEQGVALAES